MATLRILLLTFISRFVIDFLSIRKVVAQVNFITYNITLMVRFDWVIDNFLRDRYRWSSPPTVTFYTPKCCKLHDDSFPLYCAIEGVRNDVRRLTSRSNGMPSKKIMESLRTFVAVETVLRHGRMFQGSDEV